MDKKRLFEDIADQIRYSAEIAIKSITVNDDRTFEVIASTPTIDRDGETIDQRGWDLGNFAKNPIILFGHNYYDLPIGKATEWGVDDGGVLRIKGYFASDEANPKAGQVWRLYQEGIIKTVSVGFIAKEKVGNQITKAELLEVSFVPVPANPEALSVLTAKGLKDEEIAFLTGADIEQEKGAVADELAADEVVESKYDYLDEVCEIFYAFVDVYMDEATPVEDIGKLLTECANLLLAYAGAPTTEDDEAKAARKEKTLKVLQILIGKVEGLKLADQIEEKSGRVLSDANRSKIASAIEPLKNVTSVLEELYKMSEPDSGGSEKADNNSVDKASEFNGSKPSVQGLDAKKMAGEILAGLKSTHPKEQRSALKIVGAAVEVALRNLKGQ